MALQTINIGTLANDGTGDDLRKAFSKVNQNIDDLDLRSPESTTVSNLGNTGEGVFAQKVGSALQLKKLVQGSNVTLTSSTTGITINATGGLQQLNVVSDVGSMQLADGQTLNIQGGAGANTSVSGNILTINSTADVVSDTTPQLGGNLDAQGNDISNVNTLTASNFAGALTGNVQGLVYGVDIRNIEPNTAGFDFGSLSNDVRGLSDWLIYQTDIDFGAMLTPDARSFDAGVIS